MCAYRLSLVAATVAQLYLSCTHATFPLSLRISLFVVTVTVRPHRSPIPIPLHLVYRSFGNLHVRYYTRACACPLYVPSYIFFAVLLLHMFYLLRFAA